MGQVGIEDLHLSYGVDALAIDDAASMPRGSLAGSEPPSEKHLRVSESDAHRPYHTKRPHRKSRAGCHQCKKRKVKCDEVRPSCKSCRLRKENCVYPAAPASDSGYGSAKSAHKAASPTPSSSSAPPEEISAARSIVTLGPQFRPAALCDNMDMKMLWFFTTHGYQYFSIQTGHSKPVDYVLQVKIVQYAFESPFLLDCLMAVSSLHLQTVSHPIPPQRAIAYRAKAYEGYRRAIQDADPQDYPALLATSLLMVAISSQNFREPDGKALFIIDWMQVWHGIGLIVNLVSPQVLQDSGLSPLFYRPSVDTEKSARYIPDNLLSMVDSISPGDADDGYQSIYHDALTYLGSLYRELIENGFSTILDFRILSFLTFIPRTFVPLAQEYRPRTLVIMAHYLCFAKLTPKVWWTVGIADRELTQICKEIGDEWAHLLRVPQMVLKASNKVEIAKLLVDNRDWTPVQMKEYERRKDPRIKTDPKMVDNTGAEVELFEGKWRHKIIESVESTDTEMSDSPAEFSSSPSKSSPGKSSPDYDAPHIPEAEAYLPPIAT
ncbi:hypothetical protein GGR52DRAFT_55470 [Hypoxylon sp. FL1284]|nr:hypothetical protein GGR52DRAFT_55470 [Hypoxylon sp. FL1284]